MLPIRIILGCIVSILIYNLFRIVFDFSMIQMAVGTFIGFFLLALNSTHLKREE